MTDRRPFSYLWTFDPQTRVVHIATRGDHPADFPTHEQMAEDHKVVHPDRLDGYAIAIEGGWRIFDTKMQEIDPYVKKRVKAAIEGKHPAPDLPVIRHHGDPNQASGY